jgi:thiol-disulfide isomerase/thioredoxin
MPTPRAFPLSLIALAALASAACAAEVPATPAEPKPLPELRFLDMAGNETSLEAFLGQVVVLNLWATWCAPCREEMPSLDRLQAIFEAEGASVRVVALSVDRAGPERVKEFIDGVGADRLAVYRDPTVKAARALKVPGLPATLLVDRQGREVGRVLGTADWSAEGAVAAVRRVLAMDRAAAAGGG